MQTLAISAISIGERQRKEFAPKQLQELKDSIRLNGLIHPPVVTSAGQLVVGERRLRAMIALHQEGLAFTFCGLPVSTDHIPVTTLTSQLDTPANLAEIEFAENIFRVDLDWKEKSQAQKRLHELRLSTNPKQSLSATAAEIVKATGPTGKSLYSTRMELAESLIVADHLDDPAVQRARSSGEALKIILDRSEAKVKAQAIQTAIGTASIHQLIKGDCKVELKKLPSNSVDTILSDPPYGMKADKMGKGEFHLYDDSPEAAIAVCKSIISEGFRICRPKACMFLFCDIDHFLTLRTFAQQQAWSCWRTPLIWKKGTDGHSPWGRAGFIRTTELILFAVKGQKELIYPGGPDVLEFKRPGRAERVHSAEKPIALLRHLIKISTLPGQTVLDPCAGSGPIITAASQEKVKAIAIEKEEDYFNELLKRLEVTTSSVEEETTDEVDVLDD